MSKSIKEMKAEIKEKYSAIPEKQISAGVYVKTIGRKFVTILNTWETTTEERIPIDEFYSDYM